MAGGDKEKMVYGVHRYKYYSRRDYPNADRIMNDVGGG